MSVHSVSAPARPKLSHLMNVTQKINESNDIANYISIVSGMCRAGRARQERGAGRGGRQSTLPCGRGRGARTVGGRLQRLHCVTYIKRRKAEN